MQRTGNLIPVILAGGLGTRLSPLSNPLRPKPFIPLPCGQSLLAKTCTRVADASLFAPPILIGHTSHRFALANHVRQAVVTPRAILLEPQAKNTALAVASAVAHAYAAEPDAILAILPADHAIAPTKVWQEAVGEAAFASRKHEKICLLAYPPRAASVEYGYMALSPKDSSGVHSIERFVEKPANASELLAENKEKLRWAWNMGQFIAPVSVFATAFETHAPDLWRVAQEACVNAKKEWEFTTLSESAYAFARSIAFDRAVIEQARGIAVAFDGDWQDLGTIAAWEAYTGVPVADYRLPDRTDRPWGHFELLRTLPGKVEKRLAIYPKQRLSLQRHLHRSEEWEIVHGVAHVERDGNRFILQKGQRMTIPKGSWHRLANNEDYILEINEIQNGIPDENDIERKFDDYGRT